MLALSRDLGVQYKTAFVLAHKMREAMGAELKGRMIGGNGKTAAIDGGYFGGYATPANLREHRKDRRLAVNQTDKRKVVVVVRERGGQTLPGVFHSEAQALGFIRDRERQGTLISADEASSWNDLHARFEMVRINHQEAYSLNGVHTNDAESFFSRMRRAEIGAPPPHCRPVPAPVRSGSLMARGSPQAGEWRASTGRERACNAMQALGRFLRLLAARHSPLGAGSLAQEPTLVAALGRPQSRFKNQLANSHSCSKSNGRATVIHNFQLDCAF